MGPWQSLSFPVIALSGFPDADVLVPVLNRLPKKSTTANAFALFRISFDGTVRKTEQIVILGHIRPHQGDTTVVVAGESDRLLPRGRKMGEMQQFARIVPSQEREHSGAAAGSNSPGMFQISPRGLISRVAASIWRALGYSSSDSMIAAITDLQRDLGIDRERYREMLTGLQERGHVRNVELEMAHRSGKRVRVSVSVDTVRDSSGAVLHYEGQAQPVTRESIENRVHPLEVGGPSRTDESTELGREKPRAATG